MNTLNGYSKSTLSDSYLLKAGGGHIAVGNASGNVPLSNGTVCTNLNADKVDGKNATDFLLYYEKNYGANISNAKDIDTTLTSGLAKVHISNVEYSSVLTGYDYNNKYWQLRFRPSSNDGIYYRSNGLGSDWKKLAFFSEIPTKVSELTNDSNYVNSDTLSNYRLLNKTLMYGDEKSSLFYISRCKEGGGGWAYSPIEVYKGDKTTMLFNIGVYGLGNTLHYYTYLGSNSYNSTKNLRITTEGVVSAPSFVGDLTGTASKVSCTEATDNLDRPIVLTNKSNTLYYSTKATVNYSSGQLTAGGVWVNTGNFIANRATLVLNSNNTSNNAADIIFKKNSTTTGTYGHWAISARYDSTYRFSIYRGSENGGTGTEAELFTISHAGNVGIGINSPGLKLVVNGDITIYGENLDRCIYFRGPSANTHNWRITYLGSGTGDGNYFKLQSTGTKDASGAWNNALTFGCETLDASFGGNISMPYGKNIYFSNGSAVILKAATTSNYVTPIVWYKGDKSSYTYDALIGWYNLGDTTGSITILPYATNTAPWDSAIGLFIGKSVLKWENKTIIHSGNISSYALTSLPSHSHSYLPLTGGTLKNASVTSPLSLDTDSTTEIGLTLKLGGTTKAWLGYHPSYGVYLWNAARSKYFNYKNDGTLLFEGYTVWHSGNVDPYNYLTKRSPNTVLAGPSSGTATASATFRALVAADIPTLSISKISGLQSALDGKAPAHSHSYVPLAGTDALTGSIQMKGSGTVVPFIRNFTYNGTSGWARDLAQILVDGTAKFKIGAYGTYTAGATNDINYVYIGCNGYDGTNIRLTSSTFKWGSNTVIHSGNISSYALTSLPSHTHSYLPLTGGTIKDGSNAGPFTLNTDSTSEVGMRFLMSGSNKSWVGYHPTYGSIFYNYASGKYAGLNNSGKLHVNGTEVSMSGHTHSYNNLTNKPNIPSFAAKGSSTKGVYLSGTNTFAEMTYSLSATVNGYNDTLKPLAYYSAKNTISPYTSTCGDSYKPIYLSGGVPIECYSKYWGAVSWGTNCSGTIYVYQFGPIVILLGYVYKLQLSNTSSTSYVFKLPTGVKNPTDKCGFCLVQKDGYENDRNTVIILSGLYGYCDANYNDFNPGNTRYYFTACYV